ncbi:MAG: LamG-like jellyroll fold domain-containing protein [Verrucomicrobiota bacterium]
MNLPRRWLLPLLLLVVLAALFWRPARRRVSPAPESSSTTSQVPASNSTSTAGGRATSAPGAPSAAGAAVAAAGPRAFTIAATNRPAPGQAASDGRLSPAVWSQISAIEEAKALRTPAERKIDSQLLFADRLRQGLDIAPGVKSLRLRLDRDAQGRVVVEIRGAISDSLLRQVESLGGQVLANYPSNLRAALPLEALVRVAENPDVQFIGRPPRGFTSAVVSEGDSAHAADLARQQFASTGAGVRVGVLSDSVNYLNTSKIAGLPTVMPGQQGSGAGEGTAMMEIVHDLAPGAQLYFATATFSETQFATNILQLRFNLGCDVIVDDVGYEDESPFQDGEVARAVNAVTASGGLYFSSAGNMGNLDSGTSGTWEGDFSADTPPDGVFEGITVHNFGGADYDTVAVTSSYGADTSLFWSDPLGGSSNDYDLYVLDGTGSYVVESSANLQAGAGDPYESVAAPLTGEQIVIVRSSGADRFLHLDTYAGVLDVGTQGATRGHNASTNAVGVAAVEVAQAVYPSPFLGGSQDIVEDFSSDGPRRMFFWPNGTPITPGNFSSTGGAVYQKPDLAAADGVTTDVPGFAPFHGTSAAAPHAAAIAALLKSYNPALTAAQVRGILGGTAMDILGPGVDRASGAGIVMATLALAGGQGDNLQVSWPARPVFGGPAGGPFGPGSFQVQLTNRGAAALNWSLSNTPAWLSPSASGGTLAAGAGAALTLSVNSAANALAAGEYTGTPVLVNATSGRTNSRRWSLVAQSAPAHSTNPDAVLALNPAAYFRLNETNPPPAPLVATNYGLTGSPANAMPYGGVTAGQPGIVGNSFRFYNPNQIVTYSGSRLDAPYAPAFNPAGPFTIECWANPNQVVSDLFCAVSSLDFTQNGGSSRNGWIIYQATGAAWQFRMGGLSGYIATLTGGTAQTNTWQHLAAVYDGSNCRFYVNGQLVGGPTAVPAYTPNSTQPLRIGATTIPNRSFDGRIAHVALFNSALTAARISAHYNAATTNAAGYVAQIVADSPMGYWPLNNPAYAAPDPASLPVAFNNGTAASVFGLYEPGSVPGVAGVPASGFGSPNRACQLNGSAGYVDVPGPLPGLPGPVSVLAWIRANPATGRAQTILGAGSTSFHLGLDGTGLPVFGNGLQWIGDISGTVPVADGNWHQLAGVYDGTSSELLYVDGQLAASTTSATVPVPGSAGDLWIGGAPEAASEQLFSGTIDEVAIFTNALSSVQVQQLFAATNGPLTLSAVRSGSTVYLSWNSTAGFNYQLQCKTNLSLDNWAPFGGPVAGNGGVQSNSDLISPGSQRFYRVLQSP